MAAVLALVDSSVGLLTAGGGGGTTGSGLNGKEGVDEAEGALSMVGLKASSRLLSCGTYGGMRRHGTTSRWRESSGSQASIHRLWCVPRKQGDEHGA